MGCGWNVSQNMSRTIAAAVSRDQNGHLSNLSMNGPVDLSLWFCRPFHQHHWHTQTSPPIIIVLKVFIIAIIASIITGRFSNLSMNGLACCHSWFTHILKHTLNTHFETHTKYTQNKVKVGHFNFYSQPCPQQYPLRSKYFPADTLPPCLPWRSSSAQATGCW